MLPQRWHYVPAALLQCRFLKLLQHCQLTRQNFHFQRTDNVDTTNRPTLWRRCDNIFVSAGMTWSHMLGIQTYLTYVYYCIFLKKIKFLFLLHEMKHRISNISKTTSESLSKILKISKYKVTLIFHISFFLFLKTLLTLWN